MPSARSSKSAEELGLFKELPGWVPPQQLPLVRIRYRALTPEGCWPVRESYCKVPHGCGSRAAEAGRGALRVGRAAVQALGVGPGLRARQGGGVGNGRHLVR